MEPRQLFSIGCLLLVAMLIIYIAAFAHFSKWENDKGQKIAFITFIIASIVIPGPFFVITILKEHEIQSEQECTESLEYMRSIGKDVSGMSCYDNATIKRERNWCESARKTLQKNDNDVSNIKC